MILIIFHHQHLHPLQLLQLLLWLKAKWIQLKTILSYRVIFLMLSKNQILSGRKRGRRKRRGKAAVRVKGRLQVQILRRQSETLYVPGRMSKLNLRNLKVESNFPRSTFDSMSEHSQAVVKIGSVLAILGSFLSINFCPKNRFDFQIFNA